jgi:peptidoglycan/LPS O-acetylase OafA/YrhL
MAHKTTYFPGLNGLRLIAASMVVISHIEAFKKKAGYLSASDNPIISSLGPQGVSIFFVLSGFLITYLLLSEKRNFEKINLRKFYIRRILRIWPLYFLILLLGFFVLPLTSLGSFLESPYESFSLKLILCIGLLPNIVYNYFGHILLIGPLWSVGAEEQFYLIWPNVINTLKKKIKIKPILISFIFILILKVTSNLIFKHNDVFGLPNSLFKIFKTLCYLLKYDLMIIGGLFAYLVYQQHKTLKILFSNNWQIVCLFSLIPMWFLQPQLYGIEDTLLGILYGSVIINLACNPASIFKLENKFFNFGGKISYGIYMFHSLFIAIGIHLFSDQLNLWTGSILLYLFSFGATILIAHYSYRYFEKPILRYKEKFMVVKSSMTQLD